MALNRYICAMIIALLCGQPCDAWAEQQFDEHVSSAQTRQLQQTYTLSDIGDLYKTGECGALFLVLWGGIKEGDVVSAQVVKRFLMVETALPGFATGQPSMKVSGPDQGDWRMYIEVLTARQGDDGSLFRLSFHGNTTAGIKGGVLEDLGSCSENKCFDRECIFYRRREFDGIKGCLSEAVESARVTEFLNEKTSVVDRLIAHGSEPRCYSGMGVDGWTEWIAERAERMDRFVEEAIGLEE